MHAFNEFEIAAQTQISALGLHSLDIAFGHFIFQQSTPKNLTVALFAGVLSQRLRQQDSCLDLQNIPDSTLNILGVASQSELIEVLLQSSCVTNKPNEKVSRPIVTEHHLGYLRRFYEYEVVLADVILRRLRQKPKVNLDQLKVLINEVFATPSSEDIDWQKVAVCVAASQSFSVITGGPGTGKTTTVAKLLAVLHGLAPNRSRPLNIKLVAPTGKAAARLSDSLSRAKQSLPEKYQPVLNAQSSTIHRLLGVKNRSVNFKHNAQNPLHIDVLIVDEASMVDMPLMCKLLDATPMYTRVILLGDHNQLSSVETGSVLSDICHAATTASRVDGFSLQMNNLLRDVYDGFTTFEQHERDAMQPVMSNQVTAIQDVLVTLQKSHRFSDNSEIGQLSKAVINGEIAGALSLLTQGKQTRWYQQSKINDLVKHYTAGLDEYFASIDSGNIQEAFTQLESQQILCAFKTGEWGVDNINRKIEQELNKQGLIDTTVINYAGHPIMLSSNDHNLGLFNGDIGIVMPDPDNPELNKAWFKEGPETIRGVLLSRLPPHNTVYAMTIHKSQGSEFESIYLCLPDYVAVQQNVSLSRELFYTGLTRAKGSFHLYSQKEVLMKCLSSHCRRSSGLSLRLTQV